VGGGPEARRISAGGGRAPPYRYEFAPPPTGIARRVNTFYTLETEAGRIEEMMPAYSAQIFVFIRGSAHIRYVGGGEGRSESITINAPLLRAAPFAIQGPALIVGASLTPTGWAALADLPVDKVHDATLSAGDILGADALARIERAMEGGAEAVIAALGEVIGAADRGPVAAHMPTIKAIAAWLAGSFNPALESLHRSSPVASRQLQRVSRRYYGVPPAQLAKRVRAIRAAMLLANPDLPEPMREEVLGAYFDQAHLIRDIRRFTGRKPSDLVLKGLARSTLDPAAHGPAADPLRATGRADLPVVTGLSR